MDRFNELAAATWTVSLTGPTTPVPTTTEWRLKCIETDTVLQDWTTLTPTITYDDAGDPETTTVSIAIPGSLNAMQTSTFAKERKALCVAANRDLADEWSKEIIYVVERLKART
jgi:hypothetical protein